MSVYYVFEKNLIDSARVYVNLLSKPQICFALPSQFLLDKRTYVYLHNYVCYLQRTATDSSYVFSQPQKKRRAISSPNCGRGNYLREKTKNARFFLRASAFVVSLNTLF